MRRLGNRVKTYDEWKALQDIYPEEVDIIMCKQSNDTDIKQDLLSVNDSEETVGFNGTKKYALTDCLILNKPISDILKENAEQHKAYVDEGPNLCYLFDNNKDFAILVTSGKPMQTQTLYYQGGAYRRQSSDWNWAQVSGININLENGTGVNSIQQPPETESWGATNPRITEFLEKVGYKNSKGVEVKRDTETGKFIVGAFGTNSAMFGAKGQALGGKSHVEGSKTLAFENNAHAEGNGTFAGGEHAHTEGNETLATGNSSHAEGNTTTASGGYAHAEGEGTIAEGQASHAEGHDTKAIGKYAHSEGAGSRAEGLSSHAEGSANIAFMENAHAEGNFTVAGNVNTHTEGHRTFAFGEQSHAEGNKTFAGIRGFNILSTSDDIESDYSNIVLDSLKGIEIGDVVSIILNSTFYDIGDITNIFEDTNTINIGKELNTKLYNNEEVVKDSSGTIIKDQFVNTLFIRTKPNLGTKTLGHHTHAEGAESIAIGNRSHSEGYQTKALGDDSHSEGRGVKALAVNSHAEGLKTKASADQSHAEGYGSIAEGGNSHAEGKNTYTKGICAHAEGFRTAENDVNKQKGAQGNYSHSEGEDTTSKGQASHAEGKLTNAIGQASHAEGESTVAQGINSHAEGIATNAIGPYSHSEGSNTQAKGWSSHAEGLGAIAQGTNSHAEGNATKASGESSHAEGQLTTSEGLASHAEGNNTLAKGVCSHAEGNVTQAWGKDSHIEGYSGRTYDSAMKDAGNVVASTDERYGSDEHLIEVFNSKPFSLAKGDRSHVEGQRNLALGMYTHAEGVQSIAKGENSHVEGYGTIASGKSQHVQGKYNKEDIPDTEGYGTYAHIVGGGKGPNPSQRKNIHTLDWNGNAEFAGDVYVKTSGVRTNDNKLITTKEMNDAIKKGLDDIVNGAPESLNTLQELSNALKGDADFGTKVVNKLDDIENNATGEKTEAGGEIFNDYKYNSALGYYSHAEGSSTMAKGYAAHAEGYNTYASTYSHAEGLQSRAEGENSHAEGNSVTAKGNNSHAEGFGTKAEGECSHTEGNNTKAKGKHSHTEGYFVEAYGNYSHAEGNSNGKSYSGEYNKDDIVSSFKDTPFSMAFGQGSHVEGQTNLATGNGSHAEGLQNIAAGDGSHAEGRRTIASGEYQHVQGKYNIEDTTNTYAHIVGGGTSINDRKNIHTIDWNGNAEFTGDVFGGRAETELIIGNTLNLKRGEATIADYGLEIIIYYEYMDKFNAVKEMELTINSVSYTIPKNKLIPTNMIHAPGLFDDEKGGFIYLYKVIDHYPDIDTDYIDANNIDIVATVVDGYNLNKNGNAEFAGTVSAKDLSISGEPINELIVGKKIKNGGEIFNDYENNIASGYYSHAEGNGTTASGYASHAEGYYTEATNNDAHAEGHQTKASGLYSHAEGSASEAHGDGSHAEGRKTKSTGKYAHSEGLLVEAYGQASHAEGDSNNNNYSGTDYTSKAIIDAFNTKAFSMAFGKGSHVEGQTNLTIGQGSHAEGAKNIAKSDFSHVEGLRNISSGEYQHVEGKYNVEDSTKAHIVGWGTSNNDRKNIHTIDWNGNAEFAGGISLGTDVVGRDVSLNQELDGICLALNKENEQLFLSLNQVYATSGNKWYTLNTSDFKKWITVQEYYGNLSMEFPSYCNPDDIIYCCTSSNGHNFVMGDDKEVIWISQKVYYEKPTAVIDNEGNAKFAGDMEVSSVVIRSSTPGSNKKFKLTIDDTGTISVSEI